MLSNTVRKLVFAVFCMATVTQMVPDFAHAEGGDSRGGGFLPQESHADYWQIKMLFEIKSKYYKILKATFAHIESQEINVGADLPQLQNKINTAALYKGLFFPESGPDVYQIIKNLNVVTKENAGCPTSDHQLADASNWVSYLPDGSVQYNACLSYSFMKNKLFISNYEKAIYSMLVHEIVHLAGRSHDEAVVVEYEVRGHDWLPGSGELILDADQLFSRNYDRWTLFRPQIYNYLKAGRVNRLKLCMDVAVMEHGFQQLGLGFGYGVMDPIYRFDQKILGSIVFGKVVNLMGLCIDHHPNDVFAQNPKTPNEISMRTYFKIFSPHSAFPSRDCERLIDCGPLGSDYDRYVIRRLSHKGKMDPKAIEKELKDIDSISESVIKYLLE